MSHFAVLVITSEEPTDDVLSKTLAPWHEFECTGQNDEYVQNVDMLDEVRARYKTAKASLVVQRADGSKVYAWDERGNIVTELRDYYDFEKHQWKLPAGWIECRDEPAKFWQSFEKFAAYEVGVSIIYGDVPADIDGACKYGWCRVKDGEVVELIDRTNPNAKWDWWQLGGRYRGRLYAVAGAETLSGEAGLMGSQDSEDGIDAVRRGDMDIARMKALQVKNRRRWIDEIIKETGLSRDQVGAAIHARLAAGKEWSELPEPRPRGAHRGEWFVNHITHLCGSADVAGKINRVFDIPYIPAGQSVDDWCNAATPFVFFAVVKDGKWYEKGEMGWFGISTGDKDQAEWDAEVDALVADLPADAWLSVVDCHI